MSKGVLYISTGERYYQEAIKSARSVRQHSNLKIGIITDQDADPDHFDWQLNIPDPRNDSGDKIDWITKSPFDETLLLDTDTYACSDISGVFQLLNEYPIAAPFAPARILEEPLRPVPEAFPELNTGVLLFKDTSATRSFFEAWRESYVEHRQAGITFDQPSFREALWMEDVSHRVLPPEYNIRFGPFSMGYITGEAKILHGRQDEEVLTRFARELNDDIRPRQWKVRGDEITVTTSQEDIMFRLKRSIRSEGLTGTFYKMLNKVSML